MSNIRRSMMAASRGGGSAIDWESIARGMIDLTTEFSVTADVFGNATRVADRQFAERKVTSIVIPSSVTQIDSNAFDFCTKLARIIYEGSIATFGKYVFQSCTSITDVMDVLPSNITSLNTATFMRCSGLLKVNLPSGLTSIGASVFQYCYNIEEVTIPATVTSIGINAFLGASRNGMVLTCLATTPPTCGNTSTLNTNITAIYVPDASVSAYKAAQYWSDKADIIKGISERPTT